jgi:predicted secreted protein
MSLFEYFIIYIVIWWISFFISLPMGVKKSNSIVPGQDSGAPEKTYLWKKIFIVSIITLIFTYLTVLIIESNIITLA